MKVSARKLTYRVYFFALAWFILFEILAAPIGYFLAGIGAPFLQYLPKMLISLCFFLSVFFLATPSSIQRLFFLYFWMLLYSIVGLLNHGDLVRVLFGWWEWMPLLFGLIYGLHYSILSRGFGILMLVGFSLLLMGLLIDFFFDLPFRDVGFEVFGSEVLLQKEMTTFEYLRHNGFSNSAFLAANASICFAGFLICYRRKVGVLVPFCLALVFSLTLIKSGMLGALVLILGYFFLSKMPSGLGRLLPILVLTFGLLIFIIGAVFLASAERSQTVYFFFRSLGDRMFFTWPEFLALFESWKSWIFGFGFGGVGLGAKAAQSAVYYADNFILYLSGNFGLVGMLLLAIVLWSPSYGLSEGEKLLIRLLLTSFFALGVTVDMWSDPCLGLFSGICLGSLIRGSGYRKSSGSLHGQTSGPSV